MTDRRDTDEIVTRFLLNTSRLRPQPGKHAVSAAVVGAWVAGQHLENDRESSFIPLITGSVGEFYIEPMFPCFGDIDVMHYNRTMVAIPAGEKPALDLPDEFHNCVKVVEMVNTHFPGYVYLKVQYFLIKRSNNGKYTAVKNDTEKTYLANHVKSYSECEIHGPALLFDFAKTPMSVDVVRCVRCLVWPPQAADWPTRHRNFGWPDPATVDRVVSNGCDMVGVAHRQCRQHEWMGKHQWRLSFSRAEIVLINSWTPVQQIVYHLLRVYAKTEQLTDSTDNTQRLSNYHIKTLMLWACEVKPRIWWTDDLSFVRMCEELLHDLAAWLTEARCPHYFIMHCNLIDDSFNVDMTAIRLMSVNHECLSVWFLNKYIRKCAQLLSRNVSLLYDDAKTSTDMRLQSAVSVIITRRLNTALHDDWIVFHTAELNISSNLSIFLLTVRSCAYGVTELAKIDARLAVYFTAVAFLHVAYKISRDYFDEELMDILSTVLGHFVYSKQSSSVIALGKVAKLMKVVANKSSTNLRSIHIELSKAYLYTALKPKHADSDSIYCLANVYLAVLYYTTGQYQTAIDHCTLVTRLKRHSQCSSHVVKGELLPKIDDEIDNMLGLAVFYQYLQTTVLNSQQAQRAGVFTTKVFAYYLSSKCLSARKRRRSEQVFSSDEILRHTPINDMHQLVVVDVLVLKLGRKINHKLVEANIQHSTMNPHQLNTSELVELLQQSAVEHLTTYRQFVQRDFGSVVTSVTTDFEALYAYNRGDYQQCLKLCMQNVLTLLYAQDMPSVSTFPPFIPLLDDSIVSLISLTLIVNPKSRHDLYLSCITQMSLTLYLMIRCQLKSRQSVTSLSQTLILVKGFRAKLSIEWTLDILVLKLIERELLQHFESLSLEGSTL